MTTNRTFTMLKPDAVENGHIGAILDKINAETQDILNEDKIAGLK